MQWRRMCVATLCVLITSLAMGGCGFQKPTAKLTDAKVIGIQKSKLRMDFLITIRNPNDVGATIKKIAYAVNLFDRPMIQEEADKEVKIPARGAVELSLPAVVRLTDLVAAGGEALQKGRVDYALVALVTVDTPIGNIAVPVKESGRLELPDLVKFFSQQEGHGVGVDMDLGVRRIDVDLGHFQKAEG